MVAIKLTGFIGEQPRIIPRLMPETAAQSALNTRLDDGGLTPMRRSALITTGDADWQTIVKHNGDWLGWDTVVNAVPGPVAQDRLYVTGDGAPKLIVEETEYDLAIATPAAALTATLDGSGSGDVVTRLYVFTYVTSLGEESEPSPVSNAVDWQPGYDVILSDFPAVPTGRAITHQRIYRSQTGQSGTYFYLIAERAAGTGDFTDDVAVDAFQEALPSASWNPPPDDLEGLTALPNGMMAAFVGKDLYFCEPFRPHAWPEKYVLTCDWPIVGIAAMGTSVLVMTTGQPYMVEGTAPETMSMVKVEQNFPCINARGIVDLGYAVAYPSHEGLIVASASGGFKVATANIFDRDGWLALSPSTMIGGQLSGRYVAFYEAPAETGGTNGGALLVDLSGQSFLIRTSSRASAAFYDISDGGLYFLDLGTADIRQLDAPNGARRFQYWKSKKFVLPRAVSMGAIRIDSRDYTEVDTDTIDESNAETIAARAAIIAAGSDGGDIGATEVGMTDLGGDLLPLLQAINAPVLTVTVFADGEPVHTENRPNAIRRLPSGFKARTWEIDVYGDVGVEQIVVASTVDELRTVA